MNLTDESFANTSMQTLNISNSEWENIKGFNNNSNLTSLTLNQCRINRFSQTTFVNTGKSGQFNVNLNQSTITTLDGFTTSNITNLEINETTITTINSNTFSNLRTLKYVSIINSSNINTISTEAFINCSNLVSLNIDNSSTVSRIEDRAFKSCDLGTTFYLSDNIKSFGNDVFHSTRITRAIIPTNLTSLGTGVYANCQQNTSVDYRQNNYFAAVPARTFYNNIALRSVTIPSNVNTIGESAFKIETYKDGNNDGIRTINLNNISTLNNNCFQNSALTSYSITSKISHIPNYAFDGCSMMSSINLMNSRTFSIGECAFKNTKRLNGTKTNFNNITTIGDSAFEESGINSHPVFTERMEIQSVGNRAFYHCNRLENFPFTSSSSYSCDTGSIGSEAFAYANLSQMGKVLIGVFNGLKQNFSGIGVRAFAYSGIKSVDINSFNFRPYYTSIPSECFKGLGNNPEYSSNNSISISFTGFNIKSIDSGAFREMNNLKHANGFWNVWLICNNGIEFNLTNIGEYAFADCKSYLDIAIPGTLSTIDNYAFYDTDIAATKYVNCGPTQAEISIGDYAFAHSDTFNNQISSIRPGNTTYLGTIINKATTIGNFAFYNIGGSAPNDITTYGNSVKRKIIVWNQDRYERINNVGACAFQNNMFEKDPGSSNEGNGHWAWNIISIGRSGFENVFVADNTSFITPYGVREFQDNNTIVTIGRRGFNNFAIFEYDSNNYFKMARSLRNVGIYAFTAQYYTNRYMARAEFYNDQRYTLNDSTEDTPTGVNVSFVNYSNRIPIKFNNAYFPTSQKNLLNKLLGYFSSKQGNYYFY